MSFLYLNNRDEQNDIIMYKINYQNHSWVVFNELGYSGCGQHIKLCTIDTNNWVTDPIVGKMFVYNLPHLRLLMMESGGREVEDDVQHGRLGSEGGAAMIGIREVWYLKGLKKQTN